MRKLASIALLVALLGMAGALALAQELEEFDSIKIEEATLRFRGDGSANLLIRGQFTLGAGSDGIDPLNQGDPALTFRLTGPREEIFKEVQTASFVARSIPDKLYATGLTEGNPSPGNTPGLLRVRLVAPTKRKPFWRFEIRGYRLLGASRANLQEFNLTIGDDTSGDIEIRVTVRTPRFGRRGEEIPPIVPVQLSRDGPGSYFRAAGPESVRVRVQIFSLNGAKVFDQEAPGNTLIFKGLTGQGLPLANGVYLYVITTIDSASRTVRHEVGKLAILR
jgi:hypothetical protein